MGPMHPLPRRQRERGVAAVEAAIVLPILVLFVAVPAISLSLLCQQWEGAQKAVNHAALYMSSAPRIELITPGPDGSFAAVGIAKAIMTRELAGIAPPLLPQNVGFVCEFRYNASLPARSCKSSYLASGDQTLVRIHISIAIPYVNPFTGEETGYYIQPYAAIRYAGD